MESRGESRVELESGDTLPLSRYLAEDPEGTCDHQPVLLLKILDPDPEPVLGDLYFEVHEEKREVYVVTHIDPKAWPDGIGAIRFGMHQSVRAAYGDDAAFRAAYRDAVARYEQIRRQIDEAGQSVSARVEAEARTEMERFTATRSLRVGDVVRVPTWTPHALQHGVRVVEFQTPTYERFILSFAQRVLTQNHWDTAHAVARMILDRPLAEEFEEVAPGVQRIARFEDFNVWRVHQHPELSLPRDLPYAVCMGLTGESRIGSLILYPEQAGFLPRQSISRTTIDASAAQLLIAAPGL